MFRERMIDGLPESIVALGECETAEGGFLFGSADARDFEIEFRMLLAEGKMSAGDTGVGVDGPACHGLGRLAVGLEDPDAIGGHAESNNSIMLDLAADHGDQSNAVAGNGAIARE